MGESARASQGVTRDVRARTTALSFKTAGRDVGSAGLSSDVSRECVSLLWVVEGVSVLVEVLVCCKEPGLEIRQAARGCLAQGPGWILE